jgi:hypothetical protein
LTDLLERVRQQVAGMFARNDFNVEMVEDGDAYRVVGETSETIVAFEPWHDDVVITLSAVVLTDLPTTDAARSLILTRINELNQTLTLTRLFLTEADPEHEEPRMLLAEHQLLGKALDLTEFFPSLSHIGVSGRVGGDTTAAIGA